MNANCQGGTSPPNCHFSRPLSPSSGLSCVDSLGSRMYDQDDALQSQAAGASIQRASFLTLAKFICASVSSFIKSERSST